MGGFMKNFYLALLGGASLMLMPSQAAAQSAPVMIGQPVAANVLKEGTEIPLVTLTELSSKRTKLGERFDLEVSDDVLLNGQVVIPQGSRAVGEVTRLKKKGMWGKSGKLETKLLYVRIGDQNVRISGAVGDKGKAGTAGVVGAVLVAPVVGFFVTGTSAVVKPRTAATGYLEADLPVVFAGPVQPRPLVVPAVAPAIAPEAAAAKIEAAAPPAAPAAAPTAVPVAVPAATPVAPSDPPSAPQDH
jgi:hypothetical protein